MSADSVPWRRQSNPLSGGGSDVSPQTAAAAAPSNTGDIPAGVCGAPPPPPPPLPPTLGNIPSVRLGTELAPKAPGLPPAAIQNAMMTKDKKPFTYTPGGIDLSEIRSPRMQKRISRNQMSEGDANESRLAASAAANAQMPLPPEALAAMQPHMAVPVFPQGGAMQPPQPPPPPPPAQPKLQQVLPPPPPSPQLRPVLPSPPPRQTSTPSTPAPAKMWPTSTAPPQPRPVPNATSTPTTTVPQQQTKPSPPPQAVSPSRTSFNEPGSIYVPPVVGSRPQSYAQVGTIYVPPVEQEQQTAPTASSQSNYPSLNKAPLPWMNSQSLPPYVQQQPPWLTQQKEEQQPSWVTQQKEEQQPSWVTQQKEEQQPSWVTQQKEQQRANQQVEQQMGARIIPIMREDQQQKQQSGPQSRVIPVQVERSAACQQPRGPPQAPPQSQGGTRIIPIQIEGQVSVAAQQQPQQQQRRQFAAGPNTYNSPVGLYSTQNIKDSYQQQQQQSQEATYGMENLGVGDDGGSAATQSRSFRMLQKITDKNGNETEPSAVRSPGVERDEMRFTGYNSKGSVPSRAFNTLQKIHLANEDKQLMDAFRTQVDEGNYLHSEVDPRYRGPNIPSRAFRVLQYMTNTAGEDEDVPQGGMPLNQRSAGQFGANQQATGVMGPQPYVHPSQQQPPPEPKKYTGGDIPSRSFRMLQAMTPQEDLESIVRERAKDTQQSEQFDSHMRSHCDLPSSPTAPPSASSTSSSTSHNTTSNDEYDASDWDFYSNMYYYYPYMYPEYWYPSFHMPSLRQRMSRFPSKSFQYLQRMFDSFPDYNNFFGDEFGDFSDWYGDDVFESYEETVSNGKVRTEYSSSSTSSSTTEQKKPSQKVPSKNIETQTDDEDIESDSGTSSRSVNGEDAKSTASVEAVVEEPPSSGSEGNPPQQKLKSARSLHSLLNNDDSLIITTTEEEDNDDDDDEEETESLSTDDESGSDSETDDFDTSDISDKCYIVEEPAGAVGKPDIDCGDEWKFQLGPAVVPRQLSVIYEESEHSGVSDNDSYRSKLKRPVSTLREEDEGQATPIVVDIRDSDTGEESTATTTSGANESSTLDDDSDDPDPDGDSTVTVRLPLKLEFNKSDSDEVATVTVGDSKVERGVEMNKTEPASKSASNSSNSRPNSCILIREDSSTDDEVSYTITFSRSKSQETAILKCSSDDTFQNKGDSSDSNNNCDAIKSDVQVTVSVPTPVETDTESCSDNVTTTKAETTNDLNCPNQEVKKEEPDELNIPKSAEVAPHVDASRKQYSMEALLWHFRRYLQDTLTSEGDSGVTDMSRHLSDVETDVDNESVAAEKRKYQRAKTHSRLFELLQEECNKSPDCADIGSVLSTLSNGGFCAEDTPPPPLLPGDDQKTRRNLLNLPVKNVLDSETPSSSGIQSPSLASPSSPTTRERLITELIQELQKRQMRKRNGCLPPFRQVPPPAHVRKWLQDELDQYEQSNTASTEQNTANNTPTLPGFDYTAFLYAAMCDDDLFYQEGPIPSSRAFKLLQEQVDDVATAASSNSNAPSLKCAARCPRAGSPSCQQQQSDNNNAANPLSSPSSTTTT